VGRFNDTMKVGPAINGWYVEWVVDTRSGANDRKRRMYITWDEALGHYRVWGFEMTLRDPPDESSGRSGGTKRVVSFGRGGAGKSTLAPRPGALPRYGGGAVSPSSASSPS